MKESWDESYAASATARPTQDRRVAEVFSCNEIEECARRVLRHDAWSVVGGVWHLSTDWRSDGALQHNWWRCRRACRFG